MERNELIELIEGIISDRGVPRKIKDTLTESLQLLNGVNSQEEKIAHVIYVLDDASSNPNLSMNARTHIWNIVSALEREMTKRP